MEEYCITNEEKISQIIEWKVNAYKRTEVTGDLYVDPETCTVYRDVYNKHVCLVRQQDWLSRIIITTLLENLTDMTKSVK